MTRRLFTYLIVLPTLILMLGAFPAPLHEANAQSPTAPDVDVQTVPTGTAIIWCSLFSGSNFNFNTGCANIGDDHSHVHIHTQVHVHTQQAPASTMSAHAQQVTIATSGNDAGNTSVSSATTTSSSTSTSSSTASSTPSMMTSPTTNMPDQAQAQNQDQQQSSVSASSTMPAGTQIIWCGLWNGSSFNITDECENIGNEPSTSSNQSQPAPSTQMQNQSTATTSAPMAPAQMAAADPPANQETYAALGDSVAAGLGLPLATNADSAATACGRSPQGYPNLVAAHMHLSLDNVACSSTTVGDLVTPETVNGSAQPPQLDQAFAHGTPKFMSITSGANDAEWSFFLAQCYNGNCATVANTASIDALLVALQVKLHAVLSSIQSRSHGTPPTTAVTGYYQPVSMQCVQTTGGKLSSADVTWIRSATSALNQTIMQTAQQYPFVHFVPINFSGHDVCSSSPWLQTPGDPAPFHPTAQGQAVIAGDVEAALAQ